MYYYTKLTSFQIEGDYQCYQKNFIERFGIPAVSTSDAQRILRASSVELDSLLQEMYSLSPQDVIDLDYSKGTQGVCRYK